MAFGATVILLILDWRPRTGWSHGLVLTICLLVTLRHFTWRVTETIVYYDAIRYTASLLLLLAEFYSQAMLLLGSVRQCLAHHPPAPALPAGL